MLSSMWLLIVTLGLRVLFESFEAGAATYRCTDSNGLNIFTDSPSQLDQCTVVNRAVNSAPVSGHSETATPEPSRPDSFPAISPRSDNGVSENGPEPPAKGSAESQDQVTVPVKRAGRSLTVQAQLNGTHSARLILDTGADITIVSHEVARDLGITPTSSSPTVTLNTVGGSVRADVIKMGTIAVGSAEVRNVPVAVHTLPDAPPDVDGLLGLTFLDRFLVTLDTQKGELHLKKRE